MIRTVILAIMFATVVVTGFPESAYAQQKIEKVTLTVSGEGVTKQEATETALRSAVEQAFGVFVSANTAILDDELVKDEIATVSSGNIKQYEEITTVQLPNGNTSVTLKAVVSVSNLITYAQSKGSTAEFAGATFAMNMKLKDLNKANEEKAIANMLQQLEALAPTMFDYKLTLEETKLGEPQKLGQESSSYIIKAKVDVIFNDNTEITNSVLLKTLSSLSLSAEKAKEYQSLNMTYYTVFLGNAPILLLGYDKEALIRNVVNYNSRSSRSDNWRDTYWTPAVTREDGIRISSFNLRSEKSVALLMHYINKDIIEAIKNFKITDNTGNISTLGDDIKQYYNLKSGKGTGIISNFTYERTPIMEYYNPSPNPIPHPSGMNIQAIIYHLYKK
jgi:hypothetical protein